MNATISIRNVTKRYAEGDTWAVRGVSVSIYAGEVTVLMGPSGSGKTTLLSMIGGLLHADSGEISVCGVHLQRCNEAQLQAFRRQRIGFVFQSFNLLSSLTALENIEFARALRGDGCGSSAQLLQRVGLASKAGAYPSELSGGQRQRIGIARALVGNPPVLLADEPTAALDAVQGRRVMELLRARAREDGTTVLVVTHDPRVREYADRVIEMEDGRLKRIVRRQRPDQASGGEWLITRNGTVVAETASS